MATKRANLNNPVERLEQAAVMTALVTTAYEQLLEADIKIGEQFIREGHDEEHSMHGIVAMATAHLTRSIDILRQAGGDELVRRVLKQHLDCIPSPD